MTTKADATILAKPEPPKKPGKRGRKSKAELARIEEENRLAEKAALEAKKLEDEKGSLEWAEVGGLLLGSISKIINHYFPGCGWTDDEIAEAKAPIGRRLNYYFPDQDQNADWFAIGGTLVIPLAARMMEHEQKRKNDPNFGAVAAKGSNAVSDNGTKKATIKTEK